jgi:hypothetical protein
MTAKHQSPFSFVISYHEDALSAPLLVTTIPYRSFFLFVKSNSLSSDGCAATTVAVYLGFQWMHKAKRTKFVESNGLWNSRPWALCIVLCFFYFGALSFLLFFCFLSEHCYLSSGGFTMGEHTDGTREWKGCVPVAIGVVVLD